MIEASPLYVLVHRRLLAEIVGGRRPSGSVLRETELADELKVSRTPIREALRQLVADGLVELQANHSAVVRSLSAGQLRHVYQVREALEGMAAELACGHVRDDDFARLTELAETVDPRAPAPCESFHDFDRELHRIVAARSGNPLLAREINRLHDLVQLVRDRVGNRQGALMTAFDQHLAIIDALRRNDPTAARQAMVDHIRTSCEMAVRCAADSAVAS
jgi:DNA-binding GntR family transcriptional regulator